MDNKTLVRLIAVVWCLLSTTIAYSLTDTDGDSIPDDWETNFGLDPLDATDANGDVDADGRDNLTEYLHASNPAKAETGLSPTYYVYWDGLVNEWQDYSPTQSWASHLYASGTLLQQITADLTDSTEVYEGAHSLRVEPSRWRFVNFQTSNIDVSAFEFFEFYIHGATTGNHQLRVSAYGSTHTNKVQMSILLLNDYIDGGFVAANEWRRVRIPIADLVDSDYVLTRINIGWPLIGQAALYYLDSLHFVPYNNAPTLTASVDLNSQLANVDPALYGSNGAYWSNNMHLNNLPEFVKQAGVTSTRYPGGNLSDSFHFRDWLLSSVSEWITQPDEFISYLQQSNTNAVITTNFGTGTAAEAADFVDYMVVENSVATDLWEVGNEIYGGWTTSWTHDGELYMNGDATHDGANDFCAAMKLVDPTIDVAMVGTIADHEYNNFAPDALQEASTCFDAYSFHYYPLGPSQHNYFNLITSPHADFPLVTNSINTMLQTHAPGLSLKLAMTEYNSYWTNPNDLAYEVVNLLFLADTMGLAATHGVDMAHHWFIGGAPNNSPYYFANNYPNYEREPNYFVFPLMSSLTGQLHSVTNNLHGSEVSLFASTDNGETNIIAVNKTDKSVSAVIDLQGYSGSAVSAAVTEVVGTGLNANSVSYNGNSNPPLNLSTVPDGSVALSAGQISYSLQPYSLTRFTIAN